MEARWFIRSAAVLVGLVNLVVLAHFFGGSPALPTGLNWGAVSLREATPYMLAAVVAGLVVAEVALRRFERLSGFGRYVFFERLSHLHAGIVAAVCSGGALMGFLLSAVLVFRASDNVGIGLTFAGFYGALFGAVLGAVEGLLLAPPLAAILGRIDGRAPSSQSSSP